MSCEKRDRCETYLLAYLEANLLTFPDNKAISNAELNVSEKPNKNKASGTQQWWQTLSYGFITAQHT